MDKLKLTFFKWHLSFSVIIVLSISLLCQFYWFPSPFLMLDGTWVGLFIMATIDIVIGPLLTLLLVSSKKTKRAIAVDLVSILLIQLSALSYGVSQIEGERVVAIVHFEHVFHLVSKKELGSLSSSINKKIPTYKGIYYAMVLSTEVTEHSKTSSKAILYSPERYLALSGLELNKIVFNYDKLPLTIKQQYSTGGYTFKALTGKGAKANVILDKNMKIIDIIINKEESNVH